GGVRVSVARRLLAARGGGAGVRGVQLRAGLRQPGYVPGRPYRGGPLRRDEPAWRGPEPGRLAQGVGGAGQLTRSVVAAPGGGHGVRGGGSEGKAPASKRGGAGVTTPPAPPPPYGTHRGGGGPPPPRPAGALRADGLSVLLWTHSKLSETSLPE